MLVQIKTSLYGCNHWLYFLWHNSSHTHTHRMRMMYQSGMSNVRDVLRLYPIACCNLFAVTSHKDMCVTCQILTINFTTNRYLKKKEKRKLGHNYCSLSVWHICAHRCFFSAVNKCLTFTIINVSCALGKSCLKCMNTHLSQQLTGQDTLNDICLHVCLKSFI